MKNHHSIISLQNISVRLSEKTVFNNTSWDIFPDQFWAILGNTGSGKTVLAKAICAELPLNGGQIVYNFNNTTEDPEHNIGYVAFDLVREMKSEQNLFVQSRYWSNDESMSVNEYLGKNQVYQINPYQIIEHEKISQRSYDLLQKKIVKLLNIENLMTKEINMLSNGENRKIVMARALLKEPSILILDNPFQGLDPDYRKYLCSEITPQLQKKGTHIILIVTDYCDIPESVTHILHVDSFRVVSCGLRKFQSSYEKKSCVKYKKDTLNLRFNKKYSVTDTLIKMSDVTIHYYEKEILSDFSWKVKSGENWAILGPNGCGKTTLLSLVLGDHPQIYANDIEIFGTRWGNGASIWDIKKRIGWVSPELQICYPADESCFNTVMSGFFDSIGLFKRGSVQQRKSVNSLFDCFGISGLQKSSLGSLAEGMARLVLLLRAFVKQPELLVLDEPVQGLPAQYRKAIISAIDTFVSRYGTTVLYVTHQADELPSCINRKLILPAGVKKIIKQRS